MKDKRLIAIHREDVVDRVCYVLLVVVLVFTLIAWNFGEAVGFLVISLLVMTGGIRIRLELRRLREYFIKAENVNRAERAGLAMPRLYEDVDDVREAVQALQSMQAATQSTPKPSKRTGPARTTVCPNCAHCMAIPPEYARSEAKCGACGHVYQL